MKNIILTAVSSLVLAASATAQVAVWEHTGYTGNNNQGAQGSSEYDCINVSNMTRHGVGWSNQAGIDGSAGGSNCFATWTDTSSDYNKKLSYKFTAANSLVNGQVKALSLDVQNYGSAKAGFAARLFKVSGGLTTQLFDTDKEISTGWNSLDYKVNQSFLAGDMFILEVQGFKMTGNQRIGMDNVTFHGEAKCIPEPTSSALLGLGGLALLLRRRK